MRVVGPAPMGGDFIEIVMDEPPLRKAMLRYSVNMLLLSLLDLRHHRGAGLSRRCTICSCGRCAGSPRNMMAFRADPENPDRIIVPSGRADEIGIAERELAAMQSDLASMLQQKSRLAALGLAVSKINHDLRNLLASAQLFSDRLVEPARSRRAALRAQADARARTRHRVLPVDAVLRPRCRSRRRSAGRSCSSRWSRRCTRRSASAPDAPIRWISAVERGLMVEADHDQLFRILLNLARNAVQALESRAARDPGRDQIRITGRREGAVVVIEVSDTGPGFSEKARAHLFEAFQGSTRTGGTGLGLAIAAELVRAHGGEIRLVEGTIGATLRLTIPDRAVELERASRRPRARVKCRKVVDRCSDTILIAS